MRRAMMSAAALLAAATVASCSAPSKGKDALSDVPSAQPPVSEMPDSIDIGVPSGITSLDPNLAVQEVDVMSLTLMAGTLMRASTQAPDGYAPALADKCSWSTAVRYVCDLRPDVKFSDGSALTSADVVASFQRELDDEANANAGLVTNIKAVTADGPERAVFTLKGPQANFPLVLSEAPLAIWPKDKIGKKDFFTKPVTAGPYQITSRTGTRTEFTRNKNYPDDLQPLVQELAFVKVVDAGTRTLQLKTGKLDAIYQVPANLASDIKAPGRSYVTRQYGALYIYMNHDEKPLDDPKVRKAISLAVDRVKLNETAFDGKSKPIGGFFPTTMEGYEAAPTERDLPAARELLKGTECENGCKLSLMTRAGYSPYDQMSTVVAANLAEIGIDAQVKTVDQSAADANEGSGNFQMEVGGLYDVVNSPELIMLTYGLTLDGGINSLFSGYDSPAVNEAYEKLVATSPPGERKRLLGDINKQFAEDMPFVPLMDFASTWASRLPVSVVALTERGAFEVATEYGGPGE